MGIDDPKYTTSSSFDDTGKGIVLMQYMNSYKQKPVNEIYNDRHIDVNKYYIMKYQSESYILKLIIFFCGLSLIGCLFYLKGLIGETLYIIYLGIIMSIGIILVIYNIYKLIYRDYYYFDETNYDYMQHPGTDISGTRVYDKTGQVMKNNKNKSDSNVQSSKNKCA